MKNNMVLLLILGAIIYFYVKSRQPAVLGSPVVMENEEKWQWVDYKGNPRQIVVSRHISLPGVK